MNANVGRIVPGDSTAVPTQVQVRRLFTGETTTVWRAHLNAHLMHLELEPPVLDLGSGAFGTTSYHYVIPGFREMDVHSVDISAERRPTKVADIERGIPYEDGRFGSCLLFNVMVYFYRFALVVDEVKRVLRVGGRVYVATVFLGRVNDAPSEYLRYTGHAFHRMFAEAGFSEIEVVPLGTGPWMAALGQLDFVVPRVLRGVSYRMAHALDNMVNRLARKQLRNVNYYPLGYVVSARKS